MPVTRKQEEITLTIHRAAHEIGGNCVEIRGGKTRLLFDLGLPLASIKQNKPARAYRAPISGVYNDQTPEVSAVFLTHAHPDHYGLIAELHPQIPVYAPQAVINLLRHVAPLLGQSFAHVRFIALTPYKRVKIGPFSITPLPVDHSAAQAVAYEITASKTRLIYTGDLRAHGPRAFLTRQLARRKNPDYLLMEGTTLSRPAKKAETETALQLRLQKALADNKKLPVIYFSAQNLDRLICVYKAARRLRKTLVLDPYSCFVLEQFASLSSAIPQWHWEHIRVYFARNSLTQKLKPHLLQYAPKKITLSEILKTPERFILKDNFALRRRVLARTQQVRLIHSAWEGYLKEPDNLFMQDAKTYRLPLFILHTSGHADVQTLKYLVRELRPKTLIPLHTERPEKFARLFDAPVRVLQDGQTLLL